MRKILNFRGGKKFLTSLSPLVSLGLRKLCKFPKGVKNPRKFPRGGENNLKFPRGQRFSNLVNRDISEGDKEIVQNSEGVERRKKISEGGS